MEQQSLFEESRRQKMTEVLNQSLSSIPTIARASVSIAGDCEPNEIHLIIPRGNMILHDAVKEAMSNQGKKVKRIIVPITQTGTYPPGELNEIIKQKLEKIPQNSTIHYLDECRTGDNSVQISKSLKKISEELKLKLKIDLVAGNGGLEINKENNKKLKELNAKIHPVTEIPWMDNPSIEGYFWARDLLDVSKTLEGINEKNAKKIKKTFNSIMYSKHDWVKDRKTKTLKIIRYDSPEYLDRPFQTLKALHQAFKKTNLAKKYRVALDKKNKIIYINDKPTRASLLLKSTQMTNDIFNKEDPNIKIDKYT
ncbi:MAG: hypothetical protein M1594_01255, partial [Candidatus Marsarchaeota archaeon]|nr:hypothetical protein [Candidatus Marsarchaeota archaeon]